MAAQSVGAYIRTQGVVAAILNAALNPAVSRLLNRGMEPVTLCAERGVLVDTFVTPVVLSLLVSLFVSAGVRRDLGKGRVEGTARPSPETRLLARLPRAAWAMGAAIGCCAAPLAAGALICLFLLSGAAEIPFGRFALFKAAYTGALGYAATRWVILAVLSRAAGGAETR